MALPIPAGALLDPTRNLPPYVYGGNNAAGQGYSPVFGGGAATGLARSGVADIGLGSSAASVQAGTGTGQAQAPGAPVAWNGLGTGPGDVGGGPGGTPTAGAPAAAAGSVGGDVYINPALITHDEFNQNRADTLYNRDAGNFGYAWNPVTQRYEQTVPDAIRQAALTGYFAGGRTLAGQAQDFTQGSALFGQLGGASRNPNFGLAVQSLTPDQRQTIERFVQPYAAGADNPGGVSFDHLADPRYDSGVLRPGSIQDVYRQYARSGLQAVNALGPDEARRRGIDPVTGRALPAPVATAPVASVATEKPVTPGPTAPNGWQGQFRDAFSRVRSAGG